MLSHIENHHDFNFQNSFAPFAQGPELPLKDILDEAVVALIFAEEKVSFPKLRGSIWTPAITLWAFMGQVLDPDKSCRQAVANVMLTWLWRLTRPTWTPACIVGGVPTYRRKCFSGWRCTWATAWSD